MQEQDKRMWINISKGIALIAVGAVAIAVIELVWDACAQMREGSRVSPGQAEMPTGFSLGDLSSYAFEMGDLPGITNDVPPEFIDECFDPYVFGEVNVSDRGDVMGIVSESSAADLFSECADCLARRGWIRMETSGQTRSTFVRENGSIRWLFLDVSDVAGAGVAVIVLEDRL